MGINSSKKLAAKCSFLSKEEQSIVSNSFRLASKNSDKIKEDELMKLWGTQIDPRLCQYINNFLYGAPDGRQSFVEFDRYASLFVYCTRGTLDEKISVLATSLGKVQQESGLVPYILIKEYVESIVSSYMKIQKVTNTKQYKSWQIRGSFTNPQNIQRLAESLTYDLEGSDSISQDVLYKWLQQSTILDIILSSVFNHLYRISHKEKGKDDKSSSTIMFSPEEGETSEKIKEKSMIPLCKGLDLIPSYPSRLDVNQILFINSHLPPDYQVEWRFLFSSEIHGESFSTLIGRIVNQGPSVIVCEDSNGHMFGGFASDSWALGPKFYGDNSCLLFTISPKMRVFYSTGYNDHYMYLNLHQQTMPNGLGLGGQHNYFGLWFDQEYGKGQTSESCSTYKGYFQMSQSKQFNFRHLEVWGVGQPPTPPEGERVTSVLDGHLEDKVMLELAGREMKSEGLREKPPRQ